MQQNDIEKNQPAADMDSIGLEILFAARNELYMNLPYLDVALCALGFQPSGGITPTIATDGDILYYNSDWLTQQAKRTIPELQIDRYLLTQASNRVFSFFIDRHKESLHAYIDSQLETAGMTVYGVKISFTKITFGVAYFLKEKYEEESVRKENFRQNLQTLINNSTMNPDEREVNGDDSTDW